MPPPGGIAGSSFFGASATIAPAAIMRTRKLTVRQRRSVIQTHPPEAHRPRDRSLAGSRCNPLWYARQRRARAHRGRGRFRASTQTLMRCGLRRRCGWLGGNHRHLRVHDHPLAVPTHECVREPEVFQERISAVRAANGLFAGHDRGISAKRYVSGVDHIDRCNVEGGSSSVEMTSCLPPIRPEP